VIKNRTSALKALLALGADANTADAGGVSALTPEQQALVNEASWNDPSNWGMCDSRYYGRADSRLWVPPRRPGGCAKRTLNHAHPIYRRFLLALILIVTFGYVLRSVLPALIK
jgi:hypothetical protein